MKKIIWIALITLVVLLLVSPCVNAEVVTSQKETLRGIEGIYVEPAINQEAIKQGITKYIIKTDVELKLRLAGIEVLSQISIKEIGAAWLDLQIEVQPFPEPFSSTYKVNIELKLKQSSTILKKRIPLSAFLTTWNHGGYGTAGKEILKKQ